ncbi:peroxiredoxin family protein [bacterium]|nr:peroxiredoxin family protein [bacterium]MBU1651246.1 peroxiredoxin family protein [bacterium]
MRHMKTLLQLLVCIHLMAGISLAAIDPGVQAPDFTLQTVDEEEITLSDFAGQIVILHFWKSN